MYEWDKSFSEFQLEYLMQNDRLFHFTDSQHSLDSGYANLSHKMSLQSPFSSSVLYVGLRLTKHHCCGIFEEENPQRASYISQVKLPQHRTCNFSFDVFLTASGIMSRKQLMFKICFCCLNKDKAQTSHSGSRKIQMGLLR